MGRPNPVLRVAVWDGYLPEPAGPAATAHPAIQWLLDSGHEVIAASQAWAWWEPDVILHPAAGWDAAMFEEFVTKAGAKRYPYVEAALVRARKRRKENK